MSPLTNDVDASQAVRIRASSNPSSPAIGPASPAAAAAAKEPPRAGVLGLAAAEAAEVRTSLDKHARLFVTCFFCQMAFSSPTILFK